VKHLDYE
jgi:hypothetical protein